MRESADNPRTLPIDPVSSRILAERGLRFGVVDTAQEAEFERWVQAVWRGFHGPLSSDVPLRIRQASYADRRAVAVWDDTAADAGSPVATSGSWVTDLTVPGERSIPAWAISAVTVSPTHRRSGVASALIEAELRTAVAARVPVAILTASEATIYGRWGFSPATMRADWELDTRKARWNGPVPRGRVHFVPTDVLRDHGGIELVEQDRLRIPGQIRFWGILWDRLFGLPGEDAAKHTRCVRYDDETGQAMGFAIYRVDERENSHRLDLRFLVATTDDAYNGLWRYLLGVDLVDTITATLRPIDEPMRWQVSDFRAVRKTDEGDQLWLRILDVKAALESRRYFAPGRFVLTVSDPLGFAAGDWLLSIDTDGSARAEALDLADAGAPDTADAAGIELGVVELAALLLGSVRATTLAAAGRIRERSAGDARRLENSMRSEVTPWLGIWF